MNLLPIMIALVVFLGIGMFAGYYHHKNITEKREEELKDKLLYWQSILSEYLLVGGKPRISLVKIEMIELVTKIEKKAGK